MASKKKTKKSASTTSAIGKWYKANAEGVQSDSVGEWYRKTHGAQTVQVKQAKLSPAQREEEHAYNMRRAGKKAYENADYLNTTTSHINASVACYKAAMYALSEQDKQWWLKRAQYHALVREGYSPESAGKQVGF